MAIRQGVTAPEEHKLKALISKGKSWEEIVALCHAEDDKGRPQVPLLADVDLGTVKKNIYDPLVKKLEEAKKAGFKSIHDHEADTKKKRDAAKAAKKAKEDDEE